MNQSIVNRDNIVVAIYATVLTAMVFISKPEMEYSMAIRLTLLCMAMLPILISHNYILFSFTCIYAVNSTSFCRILPSDEYYYYILIIIVFLFSKKNNVSLNRMKRAAFALSPFYLLSLIHIDNQEFQLWWAVALLFIPFLNAKENLKLLVLSFPVASLVLSLLFLLNQAYFMFAYSGDMERSGWVNPNIFGGIIGLGIVVGMSVLLKQLRFETSFKESLLLIVCIAVSFVVVVLNASRGSFISTSLACGILVFMSNIKKRYKGFVVVALAGFAIFLWQSGVFELLQYRLEADTADTAGSRSLIWMEKLNTFFNEGNFIHLLIGAGGRAGAEAIGHSYGIANMSTHNDFVTALVGFGSICLVYYLYLLFVPFFNTPKGHDRKIMAVFMLFFLLESSVLEPMFRGYVPYVMFFTFMYCYSHYLKENPVA